MQERNGKHFAAARQRFLRADDFSTGQSPPLIRMSGLICSINSAGVSSSNQVTKSTLANAAATAARFSSGLTGRSSPLPKRRTDASVFKASTNAAPAERACAR